MHVPSQCPGSVLEEEKRHEQTMARWLVGSRRPLRGASMGLSGAQSGPSGLQGLVQPVFSAAIGGEVARLKQQCYRCRDNAVQQRVALGHLTEVAYTVNPHVVGGPSAARVPTWPQVSLCKRDRDAEVDMQRVAVGARGPVHRTLVSGVTARPVLYSWDHSVRCIGLRRVGR